MSVAALPAISGSRAIAVRPATAVARVAASPREGRANAAEPLAAGGLDADGLAAYRAASGPGRPRLGLKVDCYA